jgi:hypothetical protein
MPDTVAVEYLVPALLEELHARVTGTPQQAERVALSARPFSDWSKLLHTLREHVAGGTAVPAQRDHCWEILDSASVRVPPFRDGSIVCSPAATAAALSRTAQAVPAAISYLSHSPSALNGAQPVVLPLVIFERVWLLMALIHAGVPVPASMREPITTNLRSFWTPSGVGAAPGLAIEADDTSNYLLALLHLGSEADVACLLDFEDEEAFRTYHTLERNVSTSTNAHVLEALDFAMQKRPELKRLYTSSAAKARNFLLSAQHEEGFWSDKWHASPLYATSCAVFALAPSKTSHARGRSDVACHGFSKPNTPTGPGDCGAAHARKRRTRSRY